MKQCTDKYYSVGTSYGFVNIKVYDGKEKLKEKDQIDGDYFPQRACELRFLLLVVPIQRFLLLYRFYNER